MQNNDDEERRRRHLRTTTPSPWVVRFAGLIAAETTVLDLAAGGGRHARLLLDRGCKVVCVDRETEPLAGLADETGTEIIEADLEGRHSPFADGGVLAGRSFGGIVVVNYLHRPLMTDLIDALEPGGVLIYETFASGNEAFTRPRNPDHLLKSGELLELARSRLQVVAYEHGIVAHADIPGVKQRLCAVNNLGQSERDDGEPQPLALAP